MSSTISDPLGLTFHSALDHRARLRSGGAPSGHTHLTRAILQAHDLRELEAVVLPALRAFAELAAVALVMPSLSGATVLIDGCGEPGRAVETAARWVAGDASPPDSRPGPIAPARYRLRSASSWLVYVPLQGTSYAYARDRARAAEPLLTIGLRNIEELERLRHQVVTDPLTGLHNRRYFSEALAGAVENAVREQRAVSVLAIDLDGFKQLNDTLGHAAGDRALIGFGELLRAETRQVDVVARTGGDEFAVIMRGAGRSEAHAAARRILARVRATSTALGACIGLATHPPLPANPAELTWAADAAMYRAKHRRARSRLQPAIRALRPAASVELDERSALRRVA